VSFAALNNALAPIVFARRSVLDSGGESKIAVGQCSRFFEDADADKKQIRALNSDH